MKGLVLLIWILIVSQNCHAQNVEIKYGSIDSVKYKNLWEVNKYISQNEYTLIEGNVFLFDNLKNSNYLNMGDEYSYFCPFSEEYIIANPLKKSEDTVVRFSFLYALLKDTLKRYQVDGFIFNNITYVNKKKYCFLKAGIENVNHVHFSTTQKKNEILDSISTLYKLSILDSSMAFMNTYKIKMKHYFPESEYFISFELNPNYNLGVEESINKTNLNTLISENTYVPLSNCNCGNVDLVFLIKDWSGRSKSLSQFKREMKKKIQLDNSHTSNYAIIRLSDYKIIENGVFSFENSDVYNLLINMKLDKSTPRRYRPR